jgi:uncharacterized membrane protein YqaE (UPF0057 family)
MKNRIYLLLVLATLLSSCSMMKSKYGRGVSFHWKSTHPSTAIQQQKNQQNTVSMMAAEKRIREAEESVGEKRTMDTRLVYETGAIQAVKKVQVKWNSNLGKFNRLMPSIAASCIDQQRVPVEVKVHSDQQKGPEDKWLLILLAFFLPPLTIYLLDESDTQGLIISVILTVVGCYITGVIHAIIKVVQKYN